jgi:hypothetical protein
MHRHNLVNCTAAQLLRIAFIQLLADRIIRDMGRDDR